MVLRRDYLRINVNGKEYELKDLKWGASIESGIPNDIIESSTSALSAECEVVLPASDKRRPQPDMFPGLVRGGKAAIICTIDGEVKNELNMLLTDIEYTASSVKVSLSNDSLSLSNLVRLAPHYKGMPPGWGRGDGENSERWASNLGAVNPKAPPGYIAFHALRTAGFSCVPPVDYGRTVVDLPLQWAATTDEWSPNGGHTITSTYSQQGEERSMPPVLEYRDGMTWMTKGDVWCSGTIEGNRTWGQLRDVSGHFMASTGTGGNAALLVIMGGGNWVSFEVTARGGMWINASDGDDDTFNPGTITGPTVIQVGVSSATSTWYCKVGNTKKTGTFNARPEANSNGEVWLTGMRVSSGGVPIAGAQIRNYNPATHYLESQLTDGKWKQTSHINLPLSGFEGDASPSVRDVVARDLLDDMAAELCATWWIDGAGVAHFWDSKAMLESPSKRTFHIDHQVADYKLLDTDTAARDAVSVTYAGVAYSGNQRMRVHLWDGAGSVLSDGDVYETFIESPSRVDWINPDWTLSQYNKWADPKPDYKENSWWAATTRGGRGSLRQSTSRITPWVYKYTAMGVGDSAYEVELSVDDVNFPIINGRGRIEYTDTVKTVGKTDSASPYVHEAKTYVTNNALATAIGNHLYNLDKARAPMVYIETIYAPEVNVGDVITIAAGENSDTKRTLLVLSIENSSETFSTKMEVYQISESRTTTMTWAEAQLNARRAGANARYEVIEPARTETWREVQTQPDKFPYGV